MTIPSGFDTVTSPRDTVLEAEMACLGSMMIQPSRIPQVESIVPSDIMWSVPFHREIAKSIFRLHRAGSAVDLVTIKADLDSERKLKLVGGEDYLIQVAEAVPSASQAVSYARIVREAYATRVVAARARDIVNAHAAGAGWDKIGPLAGGINAGRLMPDQCTYDLEDLLGDDVEGVEEIDGVRTGFAAIDMQTSLGGLPSGQMTVLGAPTKTGKSYMAQQIAVKVARRGERVLYACFGGDLDERSLRARWIKQTCGIMPVRGVPHDAEAVGSAREMLKVLPISVYVAERASDRSIEAMLEWAESEYKRNPHRLLIVDYAQVAKTRAQTRGGVEVVENVSMAMSASAKRMPEAAILALSQMASSDSDDYRYSQQLVNDCGFGLVLRKEDFPAAGSKGYHNATLTVKANRWGYSGNELLGRWHPEYGTFDWGKLQ